MDPVSRDSRRGPWYAGLPPALASFRVAPNTIVGRRPTSKLFGAYPFLPSVLVPIARLERSMKEARVPVLVPVARMKEALRVAKLVRPSICAIDLAGDFRLAGEGGGRTSLFADLLAATRMLPSTYVRYHTKGSKRYRPHLSAHWMGERQ